jgi:hypothetical protein
MSEIDRLESELGELQEQYQRTMARMMRSLESIEAFLPQLSPGGPTYQIYRHRLSMLNRDMRDVQGRYYDDRDYYLTLLSLEMSGIKAYRPESWSITPSEDDIEPRPEPIEFSHTGPPLQAGDRFLRERPRPIRRPRGEFLAAERESRGDVIEQFVHS